MPRGVYNRKKVGTLIAPATVAAVAAEPSPNLDAMFEDLRVTLEARKMEYEVAAARIGDVLATLAPRPRMGRPPKSS